MLHTVYWLYVVGHRRVTRERFTRRLRRRAAKCDVRSRSLHRTTTPHCSCITGPSQCPVITRRGVTPAKSWSMIHSVSTVLMTAMAPSVCLCR